MSSAYLSMNSSYSTSMDPASFSPKAGSSSLSNSMPEQQQQQQQHFSHDEDDEMHMMQDDYDEEFDDLDEQGKDGNGRKSKKANPLISNTEKCHVCLEPAAKHVHYGAVTCFSCRAFFRRSIRNEASKKYKCRRQGQCKITLKTRKNCQRCRFDKCLEIGMKPSWVLSDEERTRRFRKAREKKAALSRSSSGEEDRFQNRRASIELGQMNEVRAAPSNKRSTSMSASENIPSEPILMLRNPQELVGSVPDHRSPPPAHIHPLPMCQAPLQLSPAHLHSQSREPMHPTEAALALTSMRTAPYIRPSTIPTWPPQPNYPQTNYSQPNYQQQYPSALPPSQSHTTYLPQQTQELVPSYPSSSSGSMNLVTPMMSSVSIKSEPHSDPDEDDDRYSTTSDESANRIMVDPAMEMTDEELLQIKRLVFDHDVQFKSVAFGEELIKEIVMCSVFGIPLSTSAAMSAYRLTVQRVTKVAQSFEKFLDIPFPSQSALLKQNADLLVNLRSAVFFEEKKKGLDQVLYSMGVDDVEIGKKMIIATMKTAKELHRVDYKSLNSLQRLDENKDLESRYDKLLARVGRTVCIHPDFVKILTFIVLFSSDFTTLESVSRTEVERIQDMLITMLKRFVFSQFTYKVAVNIFASVLNCVSDLREISHIKKMRSLATPIENPLNRPGSSQETP